MNDPNGLVRTATGYHAFFQHNPSQKTWGDIVWGHAVSADLTHWRDLGVSLTAPDGMMAFSGSAVECPTGLLSGLDAGESALVAAYTAHDPATELQEQRLAFSVDGGASWRPLGEGPAIPEKARHFRDPCLFWHPETASWIMLVVHAMEHRVAFYRSTDLRSWRRHGAFALDEETGVECECPELVRLANPTDPEKDLWLLKVDLSTGAVAGGSGGKYFLGRFDGFHFEALPIVDGPPQAHGYWGWVDYGKDFYAAQVFRDNIFRDDASRDGTVRDDDRPGPAIWLGWASNWQYARETPTDPWRGCLSFPRELTLAETTRGYRLCQRPISLDSQRTAALQPLPEGPVEGKNSHSTFTAGRSFELKCRWSPGTARELGLDFAIGRGCRTRIGFRPTDGEIFFDRRQSGDVDFSPDFAVISTALSEAKSVIDLHLLVDHSIAEVFVDDGKTVMSHLIYPPDGADGVSFYARDGQATLQSASWRPLGAQESVT